MAIPDIRVKVPSKARKGEVFQVKALIMHPMETGLRTDGEGNAIPRKIINKFFYRYNGEVVFGADLHPPVSANPYFEFYSIAAESGTLEFAWHEDGGEIYRTSRAITVS